MGANFGGRWIVVGESYTYFLCYVAVYGNLFVFVNMDEYDDLHVFVNNISRLWIITNQVTVMWLANSLTMFLSSISTQKNKLIRLLPCKNVIQQE